MAGSRQVAEQDWHLAPRVWALLVFAVLGPLVLTNVMWFTAISRVGATRASLYANLQPFLGAVFALIILEEAFGPLQVAGGLVIGAGIVLARLTRPPAANID